MNDNKENKKICPLLTIASCVVSEGKKYCEKENCALWDDWNGGRCAFLNMSYCLTNLSHKD
jgi:hypothetical protein